MSVRAILIASTVIYRERMAAETAYVPQPFPSFEETVMAADELTEFAARSVHGSWDRPDPNTALNSDYLDWLKVLGENSYFGHASATFWVTGGSLAFARDVRQAAPFLTITEASLKYRPLDELGVSIPPPVAHSEEITADLEDTFESAQWDAEDTEAVLERRGFQHSQARDGAIAFLPLATETTMVVTGTMEQWPVFLDSAFAFDSSAEVYEFGSQVLRQMRTLAPHTFHGIAAVRKSRPERVEAAQLIEEYSECG